jgi:hypothetical protein
MLNKMVVEKYKFGPVRDGNHQDFALVEKDGRGAHVTVYKCIGYGEHALYEVTESIACVSDEVESIIEQFYR